MNVLIIGGNRFIGAMLTAQLLTDGHGVSIVAIDPPPAQLQAFVRYTKINRNNKEALKTYLADKYFDVVFDNIAFRARQVQTLLEILGDRCGRYVLTSTADVYPIEEGRCWPEESAPLEPSTLKDAPPAEHYLRGKRGCEKILHASTIPFSILRPCRVTGPGDPIPPRPRHLVSQANPFSRSLHLPSRIIDGGPIILPVNDRKIFQLVWVEDVVKALIIVANHPNAIGNVFNVAGDELWSHERLTYALAEAADLKVSIFRAASAELQEWGLGAWEPPYGAGVSFSLVSSQRLKSLGWSPTSPYIWLPQLLEAARNSDRRPFYAWRAREVALAHHLQTTRPHFQPALKASVQIITPPKPALAAFTDYFQLPMAHYRHFDGRWLSSIGIGTHRGNVDAETDALYLNTLAIGLARGLNVIDTAINYRAMRAERVVGRAVAHQISEGVDREKMFVVTKGGFVPHDGEDPRSASAWIDEELVQKGFLKSEEAVVRHSIRAPWITESLCRSRANLGLDKIDAYLLHNPERALPRLGAGFWSELTRTFGVLEEAVATGHIECYGLALWDAVRVRAGTPLNLLIERALECATVAAGGGVNHLRIIEIPLNVSNAEVLRMRNQMLKGRLVPAMDLAQDCNLFVLTSASIARAGRLSSRGRARLPTIEGIESDYIRALQFTRSAPGTGSALVGMRCPEHVHAALSLAARPPLPPDEIRQLLKQN